ncbi:hypothetical protein EYF80_010106 [Liparis tanakae]|uniref:Uncharacterized protein n=1 Tax=Liparis tanakae TaxID=230148 RepID=A0A4Z2IR69_9TELE|nr:hypothetical protein EYF80_010106 [Liparis tanakae]
MVSNCQSGLGFRTAPCQDREETASWILTATSAVRINNDAHASEKESVTTARGPWTDSGVQRTSDAASGGAVGTRGVNHQSINYSSMRPRSLLPGGHCEAHFTEISSSPPKRSEMAPNLKLPTASRQAQKQEIVPHPPSK